MVGPTKEASPIATSSKEQGMIARSSLGGERTVSGAPIWRENEGKRLIDI
jgi:hypothetical protein